jgi:hypothetical protein
MSNFGIGLGSFLTGVAQGADAYANIQNARSRQKLTDMQVSNLEKEQQSKQGAVDLAAQGADEAKAKTDGKIDNVMNYYMQNTAPKLQQYWLSQGDMDKANAFGKWIQDTNVQQGMKYGAGMIQGAQQGNPQLVMDNMVKLYNQPGYFEDGMSAVKAETRRDKDGNTTGWDITLKDNKTGKESTRSFNSMDDIYKTAMQFGDPKNVFEYGMQQLQAGQKAQLETAKEGRDWQRKLSEKEIDQNYKLEGQNNQAQLDMAKEKAKSTPGSNKKVQDAQAAEDYLRARGVPDGQIRALAPALIGAQNQSAPMSKRVDDYIKSRGEDFTDKEWKKLSPEQQTKQALDAIQMRDRLINENQGMGLPGQQQSQPQQQGGSGLMFLDTRTGQIINR